jgi:hypothetical protein
MVSPVRGDYRRCQAEIPLIVLFKFAEPALITIDARGRIAGKRCHKLVLAAFDT